MTLRSAVKSAFCYKSKSGSRLKDWRPRLVRYALVGKQIPDPATRYILLGMSVFTDILRVRLQSQIQTLIIFRVFGGMALHLLRLSSIIDHDAAKKNLQSQRSG